MRVLGQLLAVNSVIHLLSGPQQTAEFAAHTLRILPSVTATAAVLDGCTALDGDWRGAWPHASAAAARELDQDWLACDDGDVLIIPIASIGREHGYLAVLAGSRRPLDPYVPYLANFAAAIALSLDNKRQKAELEATTERLRRSEAGYRLLFDRLTHAFALHEIIVDDTGEPIDYRFVEVNGAFEELTGLRGADIIGRTARNVLPRLEQSWISRYGAVALGGDPIEFDDFNVDLGRHYGVVAYCPEPGRFATIVTDITERRRQEDELGRAASEMAEAYRREHDLAERLQKVLLPTIPPLPGLEVDVVYEAASAGELIGGDFYDLLPLPDGRVMLTVGDVCGKGIAAAQRMATARHTIRALSGLGLEADAWMGEVNRRLWDEDSGGERVEFVTAILAILDTCTRTLEYVIAGHPAPYVIGEMGASELEGASTLPLSVQRDAVYEMHVRRLAEHDTLVLYTDGLSEARVELDLFSDEMPARLAAFARAPVEGLAARLVDEARRFAGDHLRDDTAVMVVRLG